MRATAFKTVALARPTARRALARAPVVGAVTKLSASVAPGESVCCLCGSFLGVCVCMVER